MEEPVKYIGKFEFSLAQVISKIKVEIETFLQAEKSKTTWLIFFFGCVMNLLLH